jgi:hypothetical protein
MEKQDKFNLLDRELRTRIEVNLDIIDIDWTIMSSIKSGVSFDSSLKTTDLPPLVYDAYIKRLYKESLRYHMSKFTDRIDTDSLCIIEDKEYGKRITTDLIVMTYERYKQLTNN